MQNDYTKVLVKVVRVGLFLIPPVALIVGGNFFGKILLLGVGDLFFPFITGKGFYFRIIVEIIFALWVIIALFDSRFRPRMTPVMWALGATLAILTLSTIFGENPYRSFWSNYERMEGLVGHLHLFAFFLVVTSVFKSTIDWRKFFFVSFGVSFVVSSYAYFQSLGLIRLYQSGERVDATFGNSAYLAIYIIFHLFLAFYFLLKEENKLTRYVLSVLILFELPVVFLTATRGAILGLVGGIVLFAFLYAFLNPNRTYRKLAFGVIGLVLAFVGTFWLLRDTSFVRHNYVLQRFSNLSFSEQTTKSRFTIWGMSFRGFKEHPILGWGPENYSIVFNKYYEPELWPQEPWFDRAHNIIFDWLITGGALGLAAYLSIFITALYMLWKTRDRVAGVVFLSLFAVYFFHNLFVFDNLVSYLMFFAVLGFIHHRYIEMSPPYVETSVVFPKKVSYLVSTTVIIVFPVFLYFVGVKPIRASNTLITALAHISINGAQTDLILSDFDKTISYRTLGTTEAREQLFTYTNAILSSQLSPQEKEKVFLKAVSEMQKQIKDQPKDARGFAFLAGLYSSAGRFDEALEILEKAIALSPKKQQMFFLKADVYIKRGDIKTGRDILEEAYNLDQNFGDAARNYAMALILEGKDSRAEEVLERMFGKGNQPIAMQIWSVYARVGNFVKARDILVVAVQREPENADLRLTLASMYLNLGNRAKAISEIQKVVELQPSFKEQGEYFIKEIKAGRNP